MHAWKAPDAKPKEVETEIDEEGAGGATGDATSETSVTRGLAAAFPATTTKKPRRVGLAVNVTDGSKLPVLVESVVGDAKGL
jgi:hypothetical protein